MIKSQSTSNNSNNATTTDTSDSRLLTNREVAAILKVCSHTVRRYTKSGVLPSVRLNRRVIRYRPADVAKLIRDGLHSVAGI